MDELLLVEQAREHAVHVNVDHGDVLPVTVHRALDRVWPRVHLDHGRVLGANKQRERDRQRAAEPAWKRTPHRSSLSMTGTSP